MIKSLQQLANWQFILPIFLLFALFSFLIFPYCEAERNKVTGGIKIETLDERTNGYTHAEVVQMFQQFGQEGIQQYHFLTSKVDMVYPIVYGLLLIVWIAFLLKKIVPLNSKWFYLSFLPLLAILFDYLENFNTLQLMKAHANNAITQEAVAYGSMMSWLKWRFVFVCVGLIVLLWLVEFATRRRASS